METAEPRTKLTLEDLLFIHEQERQTLELEQERDMDALRAAQRGELEYYGYTVPCTSGQ